MLKTGKFVCLFVCFLFCFAFFIYLFENNSTKLTEIAKFDVSGCLKCGAVRLNCLFSVEEVFQEDLKIKALCTFETLA